MASTGSSSNSGITAITPSRLVVTLVMVVVLTVITAGGPGLTLVAAAAGGQAPPAPTGLYAVAGSAVVRLTWEPPVAAPPAGDIVRYNIYRRPDPLPLPGGLAPVATVEPYVTQWIDYGVANGVTYNYLVRAQYDGKVEGPGSGTVTVTPSLLPLEIVLIIGRNLALVNGEEVTLDSPALLINDRTMVPLRFVAESLGATVGYRHADREVTASVGDFVVRLWVGRDTAFIGSRQTTIDVPPVIRSERTLVPVRFLMEAFDAKVGYDHASGRVTVRLANPDGTIGTATPLAPGVPHSSALNGSLDVDHYWFAARPGQTYRIKTFDLAPGCDPLLALVDPVSGAVTALNDDAFPGETASELRVVAGPADLQVHFRVQSANPGGASPCGAYTVLVEAGTEPGDTPATALPLELGAPFRGELSAPSDIDYYRFTAYGGQVYVITTSDLTATLPDGRTVEGDTLLSVLAPDATTLIVADVSSGSGDSGASRIVWRCREPGTYYLAVGAHQGRNSPYIVLVAQAPVGAEEPRSRPEAHTIVPDRDGRSNWLAAQGEEHWYRFEAAQGTRYYVQTFDLGPSCDTLLTLYGSDGQTALATSDDSPGCGPLGAGSLIEWEAPQRGIYYVRVTSYQNTGPQNAGRAALGHYRLAVTTTGPENDHHPGFATRIHPGGRPITRSLVDGDWDWFRFECVRGLTYTIETGSLSVGCDTYLWLVDPAWTVLGASDDIDGTTYASRVVWTATYSGTAYVAATPCALNTTHRGTGLYTLTVTAKSAAPGAPTP